MSLTPIFDAWSQGFGEGIVFAILGEMLSRYLVAAWKDRHRTRTP